MSITKPLPDRFFNTFIHVLTPSRDLPSHFGTTPTAHAQRLRLVGARARQMLRDKFNIAIRLDFRCTMGTALSDTGTAVSGRRRNGKRRPDLTGGLCTSRGAGWNLGHWIR